MKKIAQLVKHLLSLFLLFAATAHLNAQINHVVISQIYGAGGNSNATYQSDFVELFNPTLSEIDITGYAIQYSPATSISWEKCALIGKINSGQYYLVQLYTPTNPAGTALPTADLIGTLSLATTGGKIALTNNSTLLTEDQSTGSTIVDFVGYGTASCSETSSATATSNSAKSIHRLNNGCSDTDNNSADFSVLAVIARNSSTSVEVCPTTVAIEDEQISEIELFHARHMHQTTIQSDIEIVAIEIIHSSGRVVYLENILNSCVTIDWRGYRAGVYIIKVKTVRGIYMERFICIGD